MTILVSQIPSAVLSQVDQKAEEPLVTGIATGITKAMGRLVDPFISESIYIGTVLDIFVRNGTRSMVLEFGIQEMILE